MKAVGVAGKTCKHNLSGGWDVFCDGDEEVHQVLAETGTKSSESGMVSFRVTV
jgi:hypothetical protein